MMTCMSLKADNSFLHCQHESPGVSQKLSGTKENAEHDDNSKGDAMSHEEDDNDEDDDDEDYNWYPGDGICPSTSQFNMVYQASYDAWCSPSARQTRSGGVANTFCIESFLDLLDNVPAFFQDPPKGVDIQGGSKFPLTLRSSLHLETTEDPACEQRWKSIDYVQCLGFPTPMEFKIRKAASESSLQLPGITLGRSGYLTSIALAWSYILSCRWVEILQNSGERSSLSHSQGAGIKSNFWDLIVQSRWSAQVTRGKRPSYAPWMLRLDTYQKETKYI
jgi:hypothetical protein